MGSITDDSLIKFDEDIGKKTVPIKTVPTSINNTKVTYKTKNYIFYLPLLLPSFVLSKTKAFIAMSRHK